MSKINGWFESVSETDLRPKCKQPGCNFISEDTTSSTSGKWKHFRNKHSGHPIVMCQSSTRVHPHTICWYSINFIVTDINIREENGKAGPHSPFVTSKTDVREKGIPKACANSGLCACAAHP